MTAERPGLPGAKLVAWTGFLFGTVVSVGFNVLAAFLDPTPSPTHWLFQVWKIFGAAVWPLGLLISIEVIARTAWPDTLFAKFVKFGAMTVVATFAAVISYQHIRSVLLAWHYNELSSNVGPLAIDGLMILAGYAMVLSSTSVTAVLDESRARRADSIAQDIAVPESMVGSAEPDPVDVRQAEVAPGWAGVPFRPLPEALPQPAPVNGRKLVSAAVKPRASRAAVRTRTAGPTVEEIVATVLDELGDAREFTVTKKKIQEAYGVGSGKANDALKQAREAFEARNRKEES